MSKVKGNPPAATKVSSAGSLTGSTKSRTSSAGSSASSRAGSGQGSRSGSGSGTRSAPGSAGMKPARQSGSAGSTGSGKLSDRLNPKTVDPFSGSPKNKSAFATLYTNGGVPCRLVHGSVKHKLAWNPIVEDVSFDPVLITLAEGIRETIHPYMFVARQGFKELLDNPSAGDKATPLVPKLVPPIRTALSSPDGTVFEAGLQALVQLSAVTGTALNVHLKNLLVSVGKRSMEKKYREKITESLQQLERYGGREALMQIKSKIPTYQSVPS